jgi:hypothetical protein
MKSEPIALLTWIAPWLIVVGLAVGAKYVLGRPLQWTEVLALVGVVQGAGASAARSRVFSPATTENIVTKAIETIPPATTDAARAQAKSLIEGAK